ncbi:hypothetical protein ACJX0J_039385, partial [Zea mays]
LGGLYLLTHFMEELKCYYIKKYFLNCMYMFTFIIICFPRDYYKASISLLTLHNYHLLKYLVKSWTLTLGCGHWRFIHKGVGMVMGTQDATIDTMEEHLLFILFGNNP